MVGQSGDLALAHALQTLSISQVAAFAWLCSDIVITLDQEVDYLLSSKWSSVKLLYISIRATGFFASFLVGILGTTPNMPLSLYDFCRWYDANLMAVFHSCNTLPGLQAGLSGILAWLVDILLVLRLQALYKGRKLIIVLLWLSFFVEVVVELISIAVIIKLLKVTNEPPPSNLMSWGCIAMQTIGGNSNEGNMTVLPYAAATAWSGLVFGLTLWKLAPHISASGVRTPLMTAFVQGGAGYFAMIFGAAHLISLINMIIPLLIFGSTTEAPLVNIGFAWQIASMTIFGPRLVLSLRGAVSEPPGDVLDIETTVDEHEMMDLALVISA